MSYLVKEFLKKLLKYGFYPGNIGRFEGILSISLFAWKWKLEN